MTRISPSPGFVWLIGWLLLLPGILCAQTDSLQADTVTLRPRKGGVSLLTDSLAAPSSRPVTDSLPVTLADTTRTAADRIRAGVQVADSFVRAQLPRVYMDADTLRLHIPIYWRADLDTRLPRAFLPTGPRPPYDPAMAWQRSAIIPGWGQWYNRSYWKIPVFYAGYAAGICWMIFSQQQYDRFGLAYRCALGQIPDCTLDPDLERYDARGLRSQRDQYRQYRDYGVLVIAGWHIIQIAEAYVNAHLKGFDVTDDLSLRPAIPALQLPDQQLVPALGLRLTF
ncbi:MAG: DUF5683 domain-containing protein [Bacteroidia bacterium]|nr:DUF5683 domain-containing protein [Bacteroidia bacterium]